MKRRITHPVSTNLKVKQQSGVILLGLPGLDCDEFDYDIQVQIRRIPKSAYSRKQGQPGINNTVDILPVPTLNICFHCRNRFLETNELVNHVESHCDGNGVVPVQRHHQPSQAVPPHRPPQPQQQDVPQTTTAPTRTGVRGAGQPSAAPPCLPLPGSCSCNDRNNQKNTTHHCQHVTTSQVTVPLIFRSRNYEGAVNRGQRQFPKRRNLNQHSELGNARVQTEVLTEVRIPPGSSIPATLAPIDPIQDRSRSRTRIRSTRRSNPHPRSPNNNCDNGTQPQPTSSHDQFPCTIPNCTRGFNTATDLTEHSISDHDLERRRYWKLNPEPICLVCGAVTTEFKKTPSELFRHVFECKRKKKLENPNWKPNLKPIKHKMPHDSDKTTWYFHVNNDLESRRKNQVENRKRTRSASVTRSRVPSQSGRVLRSDSQNRGHNAPSTGANANPLPAAASPPFDASSSIMPPTDDLQNIHHLSPEDPQFPLRQYEPRQSSMKQSSKRRKN